MTVAKTGPALIRDRERFERMLRAGASHAPIVSALERTIAEINARGICHRCGRPLSDGEAEFGPDCLLAIKAEEEEAALAAAEEEEDG